jgi:hypothetical protein
MLLMDGACAAARMLGPRNQAASTGTAARTLLDAHLPHTSSSSRGQRDRSPSLARHVPGEAAEAHFLCTSGRTSTAPIRAAGTRAAISIASSSPRPRKQPAGERRGEGNKRAGLRLAVLDPELSVPMRSLRPRTSCYWSTVMT